MGRRKIQIAPIADDRNRSVTFLKRKNGLMKKAYELGILCGADVAVIVFSGNGKLYEFSSGDLNSTLLRYSKHDGPPHEHRGPADYDGSKAKGGQPSRSAAMTVTAGDEDEDDEEGGDEASDAAPRQLPEDVKGKSREQAPSQPPSGPTWAFTTSGSAPSTSNSSSPFPSASSQGQPALPNPYVVPSFDPSTMYPYGFPGVPGLSNPAIPPGSALSAHSFPGLPGHPAHGAAVPPSPLYAAAYNAIASRMSGAGGAPASFAGFPPYPPPFAFSPPAASGFPAAQPPTSTQSPILAAAAAAAAAAEAYWGQAARSSQPHLAVAPSPAPTSAQPPAHGPNASLATQPKYDFAALAAAAIGNLSNSQSSSASPAAATMRAETVEPHLPTIASSSKRRKERETATPSAEESGRDRGRPKPRHDSSQPVLQAHAVATGEGDLPVRPASAAPTFTSISLGLDKDQPSLQSGTGAANSAASAEEQLQALREFLPGFGDFELTADDQKGEGVGAHDAGEGSAAGQRAEFEWPTAES